VRAISGVAHSQPEVWQETVIPLMTVGRAFSLATAGRQRSKRRTRMRTRLEYDLLGMSRGERILGQIIGGKAN